MTAFKEILKKKKKEDTQGVVELADGEYSSVKDKGSATIQITEENGGWKMQLKEVVYDTDLGNN